MDSSALLILLTIVIIVLGGLLLFKKGVFTTPSQEPNKNSEIIVPLRLQAYERMCLYLERISPDNLLLRLTGQCETSVELQQVILATIREEFNHNLAQQIYISPATWEAIKLAKDEVIMLVNQAAATIAPTDPALSLAKKIMEMNGDLEQPSTVNVIQTLKKEIQSIF